MPFKSMQWPHQAVIALLLTGYCSAHMLVSFNLEGAHHCVCCPDGNITHFHHRSTVNDVCEWSCSLSINFFA